MDNSECVELPPGAARGDTLIPDGERLKWIPAGGEGAVWTMGADGMPFWANPAAAPSAVPKKSSPAK